LYGSGHPHYKRGHSGIARSAHGPRAPKELKKILDPVPPNSNRSPPLRGGLLGQKNALFGSFFRPRPFLRTPAFPALVAQSPPSPEKGSVRTPPAGGFQGGSENGLLEGGPKRGIGKGSEKGYWKGVRIDPFGPPPADPPFQPVFGPPRAPPLEIDFLINC
jgi:hypothetical protein